MPECPNCAGRRRKDGAVEENTSGSSSQQRCDTPIEENPSRENNEVGLKLMCDFWKILQEDPKCNLPHEVQQRLCVDHCTGKCKRSQDAAGGRDARKVKRVQTPKDEPKCRMKCVPNRPTAESCTMPLQKALCSIKQAASFEKKCNAKVAELATAQKDLVGQIQMLEDKEKKGAQLLKQADCMWSCMEESYKKKLAESQERIQILQTELKNIEKSGNKWRKTKKDMEFSLKSANHDVEVINQRINQKNTDIKVMTLEIEEFRKRIVDNEEDMEATKNSCLSNKEASDAKLARIAAQISQYQDQVVSECNCKSKKEQEGSEYVKDAREDLQKLCRCLIQKKIENEDLRAEKEALLVEIDLLKTTADNCTMRCANRERNIVEESKRMDKEIELYNLKCVQCNRFTDSSDIKNFCIDCPRCLQERNCLVTGDHCEADPAQECVCARVKEKFLDNVFDNMYSVLEKESKTCAGKELAEGILNCLKRSRNGKLDGETKKILQEFVLSTVKKNLNLTIVGGAVKTRCEMEPELYNKLMLCLKDVTITPPVKADKGTAAKKEPCSRFADVSECHCPKGPKSCVCTKRAPRPPGHSYAPCGEGPSEPKEPDPNVKTCPKRESLACGTDCGMLGLPGAKGMIRQPCEGQSCPFSNMRAAQCTLGPEALAVYVPRPSSRTSVTCSSSCRKSSPPPIPPTSTKKQVTLNPKPSVTINPNCCFKSSPPLIPPCSSCSKKATFNRGGKEVKLCQTETKHLKANIKDEERIRANYKKISKEKHHLKLPLLDGTPKESILNSVSGLQKDILVGDQLIQKTLLEDFTQHDLNQYDTKERFKFAIESDQTNCQLTELTHTRSGNLAIELDNQAIKVIEEKCTTDPYLAMSIKTTSSGHVLVGLDRKESVIDNTHRVTVRRTSSGTILLDIHKNMIKLLKDTISSEQPNLGLSQSIKLQDIKTKGENEEELKYTCSKTITDLDCYKRVIDTDLKGEKMINTDIKGDTSHVDADLTLKGVTEPTITDSDLVDVLDPVIQELFMPLMQDTEEKLKLTYHETTNSNCSELISGVDLTLKYNENTINDKLARLNNNQQKELPTCSYAGNAQNTNAILKESVSEERLLITKSFQEKNQYEIKDFFKVKLSDKKNHSIELPAVLKTTSSDNYIVVLDKEFESHYNGMINKYLQDSLEGSINLHTTSSGNFVIELDNEDKYPVVKKNAMLFKSLSGTIKVLIRRPELESMAQLELSSSSILLAQTSVQINSNMAASSREFHRENLRKSKNTENSKASTDTLFFEKVKVTVQENTLLNAESSAVLKQTASGQYAVVLNKESKKAFLYNLYSTLQANPDGLIPVKRLNSREIIIDLKNKNKEKGFNGSVKITSSGNIYLVVDEEVIKGITESCTTSESSCCTVSTRPKHVTQLINSIIRAMPTKPSGCCDAPSSVCTEFQFETMDGSKDQLAKQVSPSLGQEVDADNTETSGGALESGTSKNVPTSDSIAPNDVSFTSPEQCYFLFSSGFPSHQSSCDGLSNELKEISKLCKTHEIRPEKIITFPADSEQSKEQNSRQVFDTFCYYLPPQLPVFLRDRFP